MPTLCFGQKDSSNKKLRTLVIPLLGYTPETGLGGGCSGVGQFKTAQNDSLTPYSTIQMTAGITINGQWMVAIPYDLYFKGRTHQITGEISAQKSKLRFFGVGHLAALQTNERFEALIYRARVQYLKKIDPHLYIGGRWWYENYQVTESTPNGLLESGRIAGSEKHTTSGPGLNILIDSRDQIYYPEKGHYLELVLHDQRRHWGSDYDYLRYRFDGRSYRRISKKQILATMLFGDFIRGEAPYPQLPQIGSLKRMRGYYEGRFRDAHLIMCQMEDRIRIHRLFAITVFGSVAYMNNTDFSLPDPGLHLAGGLGLRYFWNPASRTTFRLDMALGQGKPLFYLTVGEAF
ncbi:MAG: hypothetical protein RLZZ262_2369 [Bacteroidota bacterium]|jgi:hypothetical protein